MILVSIAVAAIAATVAAVELAIRYPRRPSFALKTYAGVAYLILNAGVATGLFLIAAEAGWGHGSTSGTTNLRLWQALISIFGALVALRSSLLIVRIGDRNVDIGPRALLDVLLDAADRSADRKRAAENAGLIWTLMRDVPFDVASTELPVLSLAIAQDVSAEDQAELARQIIALREVREMSSQTKSFALGSLLLSAVGANVLFAAVAALSRQSSSEWAGWKGSDARESPGVE